MRLPVHLVLASILCLVSLVVSANEPAHAVNDCSDANYVRSFNPSLAGRRCHEVARVPIRWSGHTAYFRILALDDVRQSRVNQTILWVREVAAGLASALEQMGGLSLDDPTIMVTNLPTPVIGGVTAWAYVLPVQPHPGQCLGIVFNFDATYDPGVAQLVLSHEIFHCVQYATWPGSFAASGRDWWIEGSAEYFARLAAPRARIRNNVVSDFEQRIMSTSLLDMSYSNLVFFSWLGGAHGAPAVKRFLDAVAPGRSREAFRMLAEGALSASDWRDFATAFIGRDIHIPGATEDVGVDQSTLPQHIFGSGEEVRLTAQPLVMLGAILRFREARAHRIHAVATPGPYGASPDGSRGSWRQLPETLAAPCGTEPLFFIAAISPAAGGETIHITDDAQEVRCKPREGRTGGASDCIIGLWQMTADSLQQNVKATFCAKDRSSCRHTGGGMRLTFVATPGRPNEGTGQYAYDGVAVHGKLVSDGGTYDKTLQGTASIRWAVTGNLLNIGFLGVFREFGNMRTRSFRLKPPHGESNVAVKDEPILAGPGLGPFLGGRFTCTATTLHFDPPNRYQLEPDYSFDYTRVSGGR